MRTLVVLVGSFWAFAILVLAITVRLEGIADRRRLQAEWDAHVADALAASETPIYDATIAYIAAIAATDLDSEWAEVAGRWAK